MNIPMVVNFGADGTIIEGLCKGKAHYYKTALFNTLLELKPRMCLEIGTLWGGSAQVFELYFKKRQPEGQLITTDIKIHCNLNLERVIQVKVYPHIGRYWSLRNISEDELLPSGAGHYHESVELNTRLLRHELERLGESMFDFAYVDGDHRRVSVERDLAICKALTKPPHYILMDDVIEGLHESSQYYAEVVSKEWQHYDFDDWPVLSGTALIWSDE